MAHFQLPGNESHYFCVILIIFLYLFCPNQIKQITSNYPQRHKISVLGCHHRWRSTHGRKKTRVFQGVDLARWSRSATQRGVNCFFFVEPNWMEQTADTLKHNWWMKMYLLLEMVFRWLDDIWWLDGYKLLKPWNEARHITAITTRAMKDSDILEVSSTFP